MDDGPNIIKIEFTAENIAVIRGDLLSESIKARRRLDVAGKELERAREYIPAGGTVIDVGAYIGDHTITYADLVGSTGHIFAIEPNPIALTCLMHNLRDRPNVTICQLAFGGRITKANMILDSGDVSACRMTNDDEGGIDVRTIDGTFQMLTRLDFIKIDAEGFEPMILTGGMQTIMRLRPTILIEINPFMLGKYGFEADDVYRRLERLHYDCTEVTGTDGNYKNVLARPK